MADRYGWVQKTGDRDLDAWVGAMIGMNREADRAQRRLTRYERAVRATIRAGGTRWDVPYPLPSWWVPPKRYQPTPDQVVNLTRPRDTGGRFVPGPRDHGTIARYQPGGGEPGCRCPDCTEAWRARCRRVMRERYWAAKGKTPPGDEAKPVPMTAAERFVADYRAREARRNTVRYFTPPW